MQDNENTPGDPGGGQQAGRFWAARIFPSLLQIPPLILDGFREAGFDLKAEADGSGLEATLRMSRNGLLLIHHIEMTAPIWRILPLAVGMARAAGWHCVALTTGDLTAATAERLTAAGLDEAWMSGTSWDAIIRRARSLRQEREAREQAARFTQAVEMAPCGITIVDVTQDDQPLVYANEAFQKLTGYSEAEILGRNCRFLQKGKRDEAQATFIREAIQAGKPVRTVLTNYHKDGHSFRNRVSLRPVHDAEARLTHYVGIQEDAAPRASQEREARQVQDGISAAMDGLPVKVWTTDLATRASRYNQAWDEVFGPAALRNLESPPDWLEWISLEDRPAVESALGQAFKFGGRVGFDARLRMSGGDECWHRFVVVVHPGNAETRHAELVGSAWETAQAHAAREEFSQNLGQLSLRLFVIRQAVQKAHAGATALLSGSLPAAVGELLRCGSLRLARLTSGRRLELQPAGAWDGDTPVFPEGTFLTCRLEDLLGDAGPRLLDSTEPVALPVAAVARLGGRSGSEVVIAPLYHRDSCVGVLMAGAFRPPSAWAAQCQDELRVVLPALGLVAAGR